MENGFEKTINCGPLSGKKLLIINEQFLFFAKKGTNSGGKKAFSADEIASYRFGMKWFKFWLAFGRSYKVEIRSKSGQIIKIRFNRYFTIGAKEAHKTYSDIYNQLNNFYFIPLEKKLFTDFNEGKTIVFDCATLDNSGITIKTAFKTESLFWDDIRTKDYYSYFAVYSATDAAKKNFTFSYADDWNTTILYSVVRNILEDKNIEA